MLMLPELRLTSPVSSKAWSVCAASRRANGDSSITELRAGDSIADADPELKAEEYGFVEDDSPKLGTALIRLGAPNPVLGAADTVPLPCLPPDDRNGLPNESMAYCPESTENGLCP